MTNRNQRKTTTNIGDLISLFYEEYLSLYGDEDLATVAAAATVNDILAEQEATAPVQAAAVVVAA